MRSACHIRLPVPDHVTYMAPQKAGAGLVTIRPELALLPYLGECCLSMHPGLTVCGV
jgi:hypothetical protein